MLPLAYTFSLFSVGTFWLIEALHLAGRSDEARALHEEMLSRRTAAGLPGKPWSCRSAAATGNG